MVTRRKLMKTGMSLGALAATAAGTAVAQGAASQRAGAAGMAGNAPFWPGRQQLVISISLQFEAGSQPPEEPGPFPPLDPKYPDTIAPSWYRYGVVEGIPRLLDLFDRHGVKVTSHMVGKAVEAAPELAREIVRRGHEASGHGMTWAPQYLLTPQQERAHYQQSADLIERITGQRPVGFNAFWMRHTRETLNILQDLGYLYHIDDLSRDEPSITPVRGKPFAVVPYTLRGNDIGRSATTATTAAAMLQEWKDEFEVLYAEGQQRRRMMSLSLHDRIGGTPAMARAVDQFIAFAKSRPGVGFLRKDEIARWALAQPDTPRNPPRTFGAT